MHHHHHPRRLAAVLLGLVLVSSATSCVAVHRWQKRQTQAHREIELADVAKSWCQTIRASQVVPVYPLTEDLQPGDVFLVEATVDEQAALYRAQGFLAFDQHVARLDPDGFDEFYSHSVLAGPPSADAKLPAQWMRPNPPGGTPGGTTGGGAAAQATTNWEGAPRAAFPSYSFEVGSGAGANIAVPVQGVPIGLALLGTQEAQGTLSISDALTYGVDIRSLATQLETWAAAPDVRAMLAQYAGSGARESYLRVVTRVYLAGAVDVSLSARSSFGAGLDADTPRPVDLLFAAPTKDGDGAGGDGTGDDVASSRDDSGPEGSGPEGSGPDDSGPEDSAPPVDALRGYGTNVERINTMLAQDTSTPGGSVRISAAGGNTVSMHETFPQPLVIGYLGFDVAILPGGVLGAPVPSRVTLGDPDAARALFARDRVAAIQARTSDLAGIGFMRTAVADGALAPDLVRSGRAVLADLDALAEHVDPGMVVHRIDVLAAERRLLRRTYAQLTGAAGPHDGANGAVEDADEPADDAAPGYDAFNAYRVTLAASIDAIDWALADGATAIDDRAVRVPDAVSTGADSWQELLTQDRARLVAALAELEGSSAERRAVADARAWLALFWSQETR